MTRSPTASRQILVCQNRTCRKQGSVAVLKAFHAATPDNISVVGSSCLGQCGNGPMVLVIPDRIWYSRVCAGEVPAVVERHLQGGRPVTAMLYPKYHQMEQQT
jgi:(2Fe-2S) ferredoxin